MRKQNGVYWGTPVSSGEGSYTYATPVDIKCRWQGTNVLFRNKDGDESVSKAVVFVDRDVEEGGWLWLGTVATLPTGASADPRLAPSSGVIRSFDKIPNLKAKEFLRKAIL
jgi:hypothetical protein